MISDLKFTFTDHPLVEIDVQAGNKADGCWMVIESPLFPVHGDAEKLCRQWTQTYNSFTRMVREFITADFRHHVFCDLRRRRKPEGASLIPSEHPALRLDEASNPVAPYEIVVDSSGEHWVASPKWLAATTEVSFWSDGIPTRPTAALSVEVREVKVESAAYGDVAKVVAAVRFTDPKWADRSNIFWWSQPREITP